MVQNARYVSNIYSRVSSPVYSTQTQNVYVAMKIVKGVSSPFFLARRQNTDNHLLLLHNAPRKAKTNEVTSHHVGKTRRKETSLKNLIRYKLPPSPTLGVFLRPEWPTESLSAKQAQFHPLPSKTQQRPKMRGI